MLVKETFLSVQSFTKTPYTFDRFLGSWLLSSKQNQTTKLSLPGDSLLDRRNCQKPMPGPSAPKSILKKMFPQELSTGFSACTGPASLSVPMGSTASTALATSGLATKFSSFFFLFFPFYLYKRHLLHTHTIFYIYHYLFPSTSFI